MSTNIALIYSKIKYFSRKYFLSKTINGFIFFLLFLFLISLLFIFLEYFLYLSIDIKSLLVTCYLVFLFGSFCYLVVLPLLKYLNIIHGLSKGKVNDLIVNSFPEIKDKLINIFELNEKHDYTSYSDDLIIASVNQKIEEIKHIDFSKAVNFKEQIKFVYFLMGIFIFSLLIFFIKPSFIKESSYRLINYKMSFERPLPYDFKILNNHLFAGKGEDFTLNTFIAGSNDQMIVNLIMGGKTYLFKKDSVNYYSYTFNNINNDIFFQVAINKYETKIYKIDVLEKPLLTNFTIQLIKPGYTSQQNEELNSVTEITTPVGTQVKITFNTANTDSLLINTEQGRVVANSDGKDDFVFNTTILKNSIFSIDLKNSNFKLDDYLKISFNSILDEYPTLSVNKLNDSIDFTKVYFKGKINDDYGFTTLKFIIKTGEKIDTVYDLDILKNVSSQEFFYAFDFSLYRSVSDEISYYFEILDNDIVTGPKSAVSELFMFKFPDNDEIKQHQDQMYEEIENIFQNSMELTDKLKEDLQDVKKKMLDSDLTEWERKEVEKKILSSKNNIEKEIQKIMNKNEELNNYLESFTEQDQKLVDKQKEIEKLLEEVFTDDLKKMLDDFNKLMQEYNKDKINNSKEKLDISLDDLAKQLDRNLEMLKKMKVEQKLDLLKNDLDKIINKNEKNKEELDSNKDKGKIAEDQQKQSDELKEVEKEYNEIQKLNQQLDEPLNLYDFNNEFNEIKKEFSNSIENLQKGNKKRSGESIQKNTSNLKNLKYGLEQMMESLFQQQNTENLENLIQILDNLLTFSFNQEELINAITKKSFNAVTFGTQKKLVSDFTIIKDSLYALAKRTPAIDIQLNKELVSIQTNFVSIEDDYENNSMVNVTINQQKVLTSVNNLSLFLSEVIKRMQENQANSKPGNQNCNKPGNKPNPNSMNSSMQSMQKSLQQQLDKIMQMMKEGKQGRAIQNEMGKAISQQESMHNLLQKMMSQGNVGSKAYETLKEADQLLNKVRDDILRNNVSNSTIERQKQILTRLLEADKAENEREIDEKRKSNTAKEQFDNKYYLNNDENKVEINYEEKLIRNKLILNTFYQNKFQNYVLKLDSINGKEYQNRISK